jgi:hypothetical protein
MDTQYVLTFSGNDILDWIYIGFKIVLYACMFFFSLFITTECYALKKMVENPIKWIIACWILTLMQFFVMIR